MTSRYEKMRSDVNDAEQDAEELERQASDTGAKLVRARTELRQLQEQVKEAEGRRIQLDDQCRQLARVSACIHPLAIYDHFMFETLCPFCFNYFSTL